MRVLFVSAEMAPLVKVGGLADVTGALPRALRWLGLDVRIVLPYYASVARRVSTSRLALLNDRAAVRQLVVRGVPVYLIEHAPSFAREEVYGYEDDLERYLTFCDLLLSAADPLGWSPDLLHLNDWHAGFLAARLAGLPEHPWTALPKVSTIHNLGYAGEFGPSWAARHGIARRALKAPAGLAPRSTHSALGQAVLHSDLISTVSPTYAREVLTREYGGELAPLLRRRRQQLRGIMNGIDTEQFDPATDARLAAPFDADSLERRDENKRALQRELGLPTDRRSPLVGMVARLSWQKGVDLAVAAVERLLPGRRFQLAVLGTGDARIERRLSELAAEHPRRVAVRIGFDPDLAQRIYGGCDLFLMPSRYEPGGLGQLIAMRYGAVPVVRRTGGLADSVEPYDAARGTGTGFLFDGKLPPAVAAALDEALEAYRDRRAWRRLQRRAMSQDWSWRRPAEEYARLYQEAAALRAADRAPEEA